MTQPASPKFKTTSLRAVLIAATLLSGVTGCHKKTNSVNPASLGPTASAEAPPHAATQTLVADPLALRTAIIAM